MTSPPDHPALNAVAEGHVARRGFVFIAAAKVWFLVCGTALNIGLPRLLGDPARFGDFGVVNTFISILNMVMVAGVLQAVSKRVSERPDAARSIGAQGLRIQVVIGGGVFVCLLVGAPWLATRVFQDASLASYIRIAALVTFAYSFYAVLVGVLNGLKRFATQARLDATFATLKVTGMVGLVALGAGVSGAFWGFAGAAGLICLLAFWVVGRQTAGGGMDASSVPLLGFMLQVMGYTLAVNVLVQGDVLMVKAASLEPVIRGLATEGLRAQLLALAPPAAAGAGVTPEEITAVLTGVYRATKNVSLIPYQAVIAITFVVFPIVSRATFEKDVAATTTYVRQTFRAAALLVGALVTVLVAGGEPLLVLLFGDRYGLAAPALAPMVAGMAAFALLYVLATILIAAGRPRDALWIAALTAAVQLLALFVAVRHVAPGQDAILAAASASAGAVALGLASACVVIARTLHVRVPLTTLARVLVACAVGLGGASLVDMAGVGGIFVRVSLAGVVFVAMVFVTGEVGREDLALARGTLRR